MNRRELLAAGLGGVVAGGAAPRVAARDQEGAWSADLRPGAAARALFPRLEREVFLNAAGGTPQGTFAAAGLERYAAAWRDGPGEGRWDAVRAAVDGARAAFARLIGARPEEVGLVPCTKAGEQVVLDGVRALRTGGNVVTNDLHFAGSLHNLLGLRRAGVDVRVVRAVDWAVPAEAMAAAMDERTALVAVTLVSNVNGHVEPLAELVELAHRRGALVYADVIQAAGIVPFDVRTSGVDCAACNGYKWLFGPHGAGFLYVREDVQGRALADRLFPGHARPNYPPWVDEVDPGQGAFGWSAPAGAERYEPGHPSYADYCALHEGLRLVEAIGVEALHAHSLGLARRLLDGVDPARWPCLSPHADRSPILTFAVDDAPALEARLREARVTVALGPRRMRVSPGVYNVEEDVERLIEVLGRA